MSGIYHEWNGTVLTITSDSGTSSADLKGAKGDIGVRGAQGVRGRDGNTNIISVNGQTGAVILGAEEVGALPSTTIIPSIDGLATEEFVVQKVTEAQMSGADVDLSAYYTKTETEALVSDSVIQTQVLLSDYATNEALALQTSQTKLYVDSADNEVRAYAVAEDNKVKKEIEDLETGLNGLISNKEASLKIYADDAANTALGSAYDYTDKALIESTQYSGCYYRTVNGVQEWLNPPMIAGVEYRTTERRNGTPVYAKFISVTTSQADSSGVVDVNIPHNISRFGKIVRVDADINGVFPMPTLAGIDQLSGIFQVDATNIVFRTCRDSWGTVNFSATLHYTKA